jgi:hypothetical protein
VAQAEHVLALANRFPAVLRGEDKPGDNAERLGFAQIAYNRNHFTFAAHLWAEALASDPEPTDNRQAGHRYNAACAAALAGAGQDKVEPPPDDEAKAKLRQQALDWLRAELTGWAKLLESGTPQARPAIDHRLEHWQHDSNLACVRDAEALAKLPSDEQKAWRDLWSDVGTLIQKARTLRP